MSDLSKIKVGSTTYDIKDAVAREELGNFLPVVDPVVEENPDNHNLASLYFKDNKSSITFYDGEPQAAKSLDISIQQDSDATNPVSLLLGANSNDWETGSSIILSSDGNISLDANGNIAIAGNDITIAGETYSIDNPSAFKNALGITNSNVLYGVCSTGASTAAKTVTINGLDSYEEGITISVLFLAPNTSSTAPTLNVNSLGAKTIARGVVNGSAQPMQTWSQGSVISLTYIKTGTTYVWIANDYQDTTYSAANSVQPVSSTAAVGTSTAYARANHVHNITKNTITSVLGYTPPTTNTTYSAATTVQPVATAAVTGTSTAYARADHVHNITGATVTNALGFTPISGTNIKTVNNISLLGSGNIEIAGSDNGVDPEIIVGSTQPTNTNARIWIIP